MKDKIIKMLEPADLEIREMNEKTRTIWHRISKEVKDRMGDIVRIDGIDVRNFRKKPTVLYGHNYSGFDPIPVVGENIGFRKEGKAFYAGTRFLNPEEQKLSAKLADLANDTWVLSKMKLVGWSIGFIPKETEPIREKVGDQGEEMTTGLDFKKSELLEYSLVLIPANQDAVNDAMRKGLVSGALMEVKAKEATTTAIQKAADAAQLGQAVIVPAGMVSAGSETITVGAGLSVPGESGSDRRWAMTENPPAGFSGVEEFYVKTEPNYPDDAGTITKPSKENHVCAVGKGNYDKYRSGSREHEGKTYTIRYGRKRGTDEWEEYEYFYAKDTWTAAEAGAHCESHDGKFEPASGEDAVPCPVCSMRIEDADAPAGSVDIHAAGPGPGKPALARPAKKTFPHRTGGKLNPELLKLLQKIGRGEELTAEEKAEYDRLLQSAQATEPVRRIELTDGNGARPEGSDAIKRIYGSMTKNAKGEDVYIPPVPTRQLAPVEQEMQSHFDDCYILASLLRVNPRELKTWQQISHGTSALRKAMDTATSGEGSQWIPTALSANLIEKYRLTARVASLFDEIAMPTDPFKIPTSLADMNFYLTSESLTAEPAKTPTTKLTTGDLTLTSKKLRARSIWSEELDESSIIPILARVKDNIALSAGLAVEDVIINGDTTATHQDSDVTDSKDHRKAWKGLRKLVVAGAFNDLSTFDKDTTRGLLVDMGKYGITPSEVVWIAGVVSYNKLRGLAELLTVDKYGPAATILTGEVGKLYGSPVITSEKIRENLNASGVYDGATTTYTLLIAVNRRAFIIGNRGLWKLTVKFDDDVDQYILNVRFRKDFLPIYAATDPLVAVGYKIS